MPAQYAHLDGRRYVNADFVSAVRQLYPATTRKIPLGFSTYTGWTGKDEVLFVQQGDTDPDVDFNGPVYQVSFDPSHPEAFEQKILGEVKHATLADRPLKKRMARQRLSREDELEARWGTTLMERQAAQRRQAARNQGLYGYPKSVQAACQGAAGRLTKKALTLVRRAMAKDDTVIGFLETHAKRSRSLPARVLVAAYRASVPKLEAEFAGIEEVPGFMPVAGKVKFGAYGYPAVTAYLGLTSCAALREAAGEIASDLHARRIDQHGPITSFLGDHCKTARCGASRLILDCYPEATLRLRSASEPPSTVDEWLAWDPVSG